MVLRIPRSRRSLALFLALLLIVGASVASASILSQPLSGNAEVVVSETIYLDGAQIDGHTDQPALTTAVVKITPDRNSFTSNFIADSNDTVIHKLTVGNRASKGSIARISLASITHGANLTAGEYPVQALSDVDSSPDKGTHSNFTAQKHGPDSIYDTIAEGSIVGGPVQIEDYVDNNSSNVDGIADKGTHSNFQNEKAKDGAYDTLTEQKTISAGNTTILNESFEGAFPPTGWTAGTYWTRQSDRVYDGTYSARCTGPFSATTDLTTPALDCSFMTAIYVDFWFYHQNLDSGSDLVLQFYNGSSWNNIANLDSYSENVWWHYVLKVVDSQYLINGFQIRFRSTSLANDERAWIDLVTVKKENSDNYELDLEVQFTDVNYALLNKYLCIYTGGFGAENLRVDVWIGSSWAVLIPSLTQNSWNNVSVSSYLTSSTFTIRFKAANETSDPTQNSWQIDAVLLNLSGTNPDTYVLDLEVQWTDIPYIFPNEELAIYAGTLGNETLRVDVWSEGTWTTLIPALSSGWNNVTITSYLNSSSFTIRFKGTLESSDTYRNTWQIDTTLITISGALPPGETEIYSELSLSNTIIDYGNSIVKISPGMWLVHIPANSNLDVYLWLRTSYTVPYGQYLVEVHVALEY